MYYSACIYTIGTCTIKMPVSQQNKTEHCLTLVRSLVYIKKKSGYKNYPCGTL